MTDANVLQGQAKRRVGLVDYAIVARGASAIVERCAALRREATASPWSTPYQTKTSCNSVPPAPT